MRRLPAIRRKGNYISEIDSARKRQRQYEDEEGFEYEEDMQGGVLLEATPSTGKVMTRRCRIVRQRDLKHEPEFYQRRSRMKVDAVLPRAAAAANFNAAGNFYAGSGYFVDKFVRKPEYAIYDEIDDYQEPSYFPNDFDGASPLFVVGQQQHHPPARATSNGGVYRRLPANVWNQREAVGGADAVIVPNNMMPESSINSKIDHHMGEVDGDELRRDYSTNVHQDAGGVPEYSSTRLRRGTYNYVDSLDGEIQEQIEVVDDDAEQLDDELSNLDRHPFNKFAAEGPIDLHRLYDEMVKYKEGTNEELIDQFFIDPEMMYPLNVIDLMNAAVTSTPETNAQAVASLAMQINVLKRDLLRMKQEIVDWRAVCAAKEGPFVAPGRKFQPLADVTRDWKIPAVPPLREVDLVMLAREMSNYRTGKQQVRNEDIIRRFIRMSLEKLVPHDVVREFTVKNRIQSRKDKARDIGEFAKNQITGIVLDLMGLYNVNELDERGLNERGHYFNLANKLMKYAMNDMRRISPKRREAPI